MRIIEGVDKNKEIIVTHSDFASFKKMNGLEKGQIVVLQWFNNGDQDIYYIIDKYRTNYLLYLFMVLVLVVVLIGRKQGFMALVGLMISIFIIIKGIIPLIINGSNPLLVSAGGAYIIAVFSIYTAHGFKKRTSIALLSTLVTLTISFGVAVTFVYIAKLYGLGSEEAFYLQLGPLQKVNLRGLLLGGIMIGALGVLDDVTTAQAAAVDELSKANQNLTKKELYQKGMSIGKEHIASMINTLALAYIGAAFPLFLLFTLNNDTPVWITLNSEFISEEIVRTIVGSIALVLAVPISTSLSVYFLGGKVSKS